MIRNYLSNYRNTTFSQTCYRCNFTSQDICDYLVASILGCYLVGLPFFGMFILLKHFTNIHNQITFIVDIVISLLTSVLWWLFNVKLHNFILDCINPLQQSNNYETQNNNLIHSI